MPPQVKGGPLPTRGPGEAFTLDKVVQWKGTARSTPHYLVFPARRAYHMCPSSVEFCHKVGLDYVSCSPFRVPIARLAAAQAAIKG